MVKIKNLVIFFAMVLLQLIAIIPGVSAQDYEYYGDWWLFGGLCFFWVIIWFVISILVAIWVYKDAEKRGSSGALWLIVVIILGIIGIIIWLVVRPPIGGAPKAMDQSDRRCPNCGRPIPMDARVCPYCGKKFEEFL